MSGKSSIEWTDITWNPVTGCSKLTAGCKHCYAERMAGRLKLMGNKRYENGFKVSLHEDLLEVPKKWRKPRRIFVNSMSDLFHEDVPTQFILQIFETMNDCPQHTFQVLTKRSERICNLAHKLHWTKNIWMGVSVENDAMYHRIYDLLTIPATVRFLSCEPLLGPTEHLPLQGIDWVIVGGESGPGARPIEVDWVRSIRNQCLEAEVAFFFKQWGGVQKHRKGRLLEGRTYSDMPTAESTIQLCP